MDGAIVENRAADIKKLRFTDTVTVHSDIPDSSRDLPSSEEKKSEGRRRRNQRERQKRRFQNRYEFNNYRALDREAQARYDGHVAQLFERRLHAKISKGLPVAPSNTTQYIIDEHNSPLPRSLTCSPRLPASSNDENIDALEKDESDEDNLVYSPPDSTADCYIEQDFCEQYDKFQFNRLNDMNKADLIRSHIKLEQLWQLERAKSRLLRTTLRNYHAHCNGEPSSAPLPELPAHLLESDDDANLDDL